MSFLAPFVTYPKVRKEFQHIAKSEISPFLAQQPHYQRILERTISREYVLHRLLEGEILKKDNIVDKIIILSYLK